MIEQKLEKQIIQKLKESLFEAKIKNVEISGLFTSLDDKATEGNSNASIQIKVYPPSFATATIPDAEIQIDIGLAIRADVDYDGKKYFDICDCLSKFFYRYQLKMDDITETFHVPYEFDPTGLRLETADCGIDRDQCIFVYTRTLTLTGIITCCYPNLKNVEQN